MSVAESDRHKNTVRDEFTRQADAYATAPVITDAERISRLINAINPSPDSRALEIATGPGHVAMALAARCREVVGIDLTPAPLAIANRLSRERGVTNVRFQLGEADRLAFADGEFDLVVCRFAVHHFENPPAIVGEMVRVCRPGGIVAIEDVFASEQPARAAYYNRIERLFDTSHTNALPLSELAALMGRAGLEIESVSSERIESKVDQRISMAPAPSASAAEVYRLVDDDRQNDLSGMRPFMRNGERYFVLRTATLICRKVAG
jgi:ubiquinone/menaquinone biosynthesis C-methylase UbiE